MNTPHEPSLTSKDEMDGIPSSRSPKATGGWKFCKSLIFKGLGGPGPRKWLIGKNLG